MDERVREEGVREEVEGVVAEEVRVTSGKGRSDGE